MATRLRLLGGFELDIDGQPIVVQPSVQRVVAMVALAPRSVGRGYVAGSLWPDHDERRAHANLRSSLWRLGCTAPDTVVASKSALRLADHVWVDVHAGPDPDGSGPGMPQLIEPAPFEGLMDGLLPDWYDDWLLVERERLRQRRLAALEASARAAIDVGEFGAGIQWALSAVAAAPLRESAHRLVIEAHLAEHNESAARRSLDCCRTLLRDADIAPSVELVDLVERGSDMTLAL